MKSEKFILTGELISTDPFPYRACGLDGIFLVNGYTVEHVDGEEFVSIKRLEELHQAIGRHLVTHRKALSPKEIRFLRRTMDLTQAELARMLGNNSQSVARWEKGETDMPGAAEKLLRLIFMLCVTGDKDFDGLKQLATGSEPDDTDEMKPKPAQFELFGSWLEKEAA